MRMLFFFCEKNMISKLLAKTRTAAVMQQQRLLTANRPVFTKNDVTIKLEEELETVKLG